MYDLQFASGTVSLLLSRTMAPTITYHHHQTGNRTTFSFNYYKLTLRLHQTSSQYNHSLLFQSPQKSKHTIITS